MCEELGFPRAYITLPKEDNDELIAFASSIRMPLNRIIVY